VFVLLKLFNFVVAPLLHPHCTPTWDHRNTHS